MSPTPRPVIHIDPVRGGLSICVGRYSLRIPHQRLSRPTPETRGGRLPGAWGAVRLRPLFSHMGALRHRPTQSMEQRDRGNMRHLHSPDKLPVGA